MAGFSVTVNFPTSATRAIELQWVARALEIVAQRARSAGGLITGETISADGQSSLASYTYTPGASS
jgi:hypothetical protein